MKVTTKQILVLKLASLHNCECNTGTGTITGTVQYCTVSRPLTPDGEPEGK